MRMTTPPPVADTPELQQMSVTRKEKAVALVEIRDRRVSFESNRGISFSDFTQGTSVLTIRESDWDPWVKWAENKPPSTATGVMRTVMDIFAEKLGFCYVVDTPSDVHLGMPLGNGSFTGILGELNRWEADLSMIPLSVNQVRAEAVDFSESLYVDQHNLFYKRPKAEADVVGFLRPFSLAVSVPWEPRNVPVRMVAGIWLLATLIIGTVYRSNLKAMLILPKVAVPFDTFEEFAEVDLPGLILRGSIIDAATKFAEPNSTLGKIRMKSDTDHDVARSLLKVFKGEVAGIASVSGITAINHYDFTTNGYCQLAITRSGIFSTSIALGFPKGSPLKPKIDFVIRGLKEFGILQHLFEREIPNGTICLKPPASTSSSSVELRPLELGDFYGIFSLYSGGMAIATLVFVMEHLVKRLAGRSSREV
ncbi:glutamate receptor-like [Penaeus monodon]|uniref:glutamate receptor-like n=1 Tax=Penaeus monodon TaxID=6687 RepID=UPI0018A7565D|nr:glutamate receptor-like [Penaeus monodon]